MGLDGVKDQIVDLIDLAQVVALKKERDLPVADHSFHMVFSGPPGTGKTTIARYIGKIFYELNLLRKDKLKEVLQKADLVGRFQGDTPTIVKDVVMQALDGVLFIDEAYCWPAAAAHGPDGQLQPRGDRHPAETDGGLSRPPRMHLRGIYRRDAALRRRQSWPESRISTRLEFDSYSEEELFEIFLRMVDKHRMSLTDDARDEARKYVAELARDGAKDPSFGNAREVRRMFEALQPIQASRLAHEHGGDNGIQSISDDLLLGIEAADIIKLTERR